MSERAFDGGVGTCGNCGVTLLVVDREIEDWLRKEVLTDMPGERSEIVAMGLHRFELGDNKVGVLTEPDGSFKCPRCGHPGLLPMVRLN